MCVKKQIFNKHKDWLRYAIHLGANKTDAKDIVSEMYFKIINKLNNGLNIDYGDSFNHLYIIMTLKGLFIDKKRKNKKEMLTLRMDNNGDVVVLNKAGRKISAIPKKLKAPQRYDFYKLHKELEKRLNIIQKTNKNLYFIDKQIEMFKDIYYNTDGNITKYANEKNISYWKAYHCFNNIKKLIKKTK
jgi:hypothetical protein